jgi:hypothetical protein
MQNRWIAAAVIVVSLLVLGLQTRIVGGFLMGDFRAFYCAARVASHGADPYHAEPLRSCETSLGRIGFFKRFPDATIPAPLPGYVLAALVPLSLLPFAAAAPLWAAILLLACIAGVIALARFARSSWEVALAVFAFSLAALSVPFGEVVPIAVACICISAYFAQCGRWRAAALSAAGAMIEPHLGLPVCLTLAIWAPRTRIPLALSAVALGAVSLAFLGPATNLEYFTGVLPAHALSEIGRDTQYSLSSVLYSLGAGQGVALRVGALWYVGMLALGTLAGGLLARKTGNVAFLVCVPPAFAVFGGTFIHATQIAVALPAALLLLTFTKKSKEQALALVALLALAVPWSWVVSPPFMIAPLFPVAYLAWQFWRGNLRAVLLTALAAAALWTSLLALPRPASHEAAHRVAPVIDAHLAEASWSTFTETSSTNGITAWMVRVPTWVGLALLLSLLSAEAGLVQLSGNRSTRYVPREIS